MASSSKLIAPYLGLHPFEPDDYPFFFGRDHLVDQLISKLKLSTEKYQIQFISIIGQSGTGKSSLVKAGLLADLHRGMLKGVGTQWKIIEFTPSKAPFFEFSRALLTTIKKAENKTIAEINKLLDKLQNDEIDFPDILDDLTYPVADNLLIFVDQFEELFRMENGQTIQQDFVDYLIDVSKYEGIYVIITMRSEFLNNCNKIDGLIEEINKGFFAVPKLKENHIREIITKPQNIKLKNHSSFEISGSLVDDLVAKVSDNNFLLPVLEHSLLYLWMKAHHATPVVIDKTIYDVLAADTSLINTHADELYNRYDAKQKKLVKNIFLALININTNEAVRNPVNLRTLKKLVQEKNSIKLFMLLNNFYKAPAYFIKSCTDDWNNTPEEDLFFDLMHESIIWEWKKYQDWIADVKSVVADFKHYAAVASIEANPLTLGALETLQEKLKNPYFTVSWLAHFTGDSEDLIDEQYEKIKQLKNKSIREHVRKENIEKWNRRIKIILSIIFVVIIAVISIFSNSADEKAKFENNFNQIITKLGKDDYSSAKRRLDYADNFDDFYFHPSLDTQSQVYVKGFVDSLTIEAQTAFKPEVQIQLKQGVFLDNNTVVAIPRSKQVEGSQNIVLFSSANNKAISKNINRNNAQFEKIFSLAYDSNLFIVSWTEFDDKKEKAAEHGFNLYSIDNGEISFKSTYSYSKFSQTNKYIPKIQSIVSNEPGTLILGDSKGAIMVLGLDANDQFQVSKRDCNVDGEPLHVGAITQLRFNPNNSKQFAAASADHTASAWNLTNSLCSHEKDFGFGHTGQINSIAFSEDEQWLGTASQDGDIRLWDFGSQMPSALLRSKIAAVTNVFFINNQLLLSIHTDQSVRFWPINLDIQEVVQQVPPYIYNAPLGQILNLWVDDVQVAVLLDTGEVSVFDLAKIQALNHFKYLDSQAVEALIWADADKLGLDEHNYIKLDKGNMTLSLRRDDKLLLELSLASNLSDNLKIAFESKQNPKNLKLLYVEDGAVYELSSYLLADQ